MNVTGLDAPATARRGAPGRAAQAQRQAWRTLRVAVAFVAAAATAALVTGSGQVWLPVHLLLLGGVLGAISAATQLFAVTWSAAPAPSDRVAGAQRWLLAVGAAGVVGSRHLDLPLPAIAASGAAVLVALLLLAAILFRIRSTVATDRFVASIDCYLLALVLGLARVWPVLAWSAASPSWCRIARLSRSDHPGPRATRPAAGLRHHPVVALPGGWAATWRRWRSPPDGRRWQARRDRGLGWPTRWSVAGPCCWWSSCAPARRHYRHRGEDRRRDRPWPPHRGAAGPRHPADDRPGARSHVQLARVLGAVRDATVVDLFAGSGALGLEALSRGAAHVTFVERDRRAVVRHRREPGRARVRRSGQVVAADASPT
jgi:hypothetical protein